MEIQEIVENFRAYLCFRGFLNKMEFHYKRENIQPENRKEKKKKREWHKKKKKKRLSRPHYLSILFKIMHNRIHGCRDM